MKMNSDEITDKGTAVLFDWDFTLAYTLKIDLSPIERTAALFQSVGVTYPVEAFRAARHSLLKDIALGQTNGAIKPQTRREIMYFYRQMLARLGHVDAGEELAYRIYIAYGKLPTTLYADVLPTLQALHQAGVKMGILSNHSRSVRPMIEKLVGQFIAPTRITISEELGVHKPSKTIFHRAAMRLRVPPARCMYVGDNLQVDAIGAVEQGGYGRGLWLDRLNQGTTQDIPSEVGRVTTLSQVLKFVPAS